MTANTHLYQACRLPQFAGPAGWNEILPPRRPCPALSGAHSADIAIIGAGFAGLSAAHRLQQLDPGLAIAIVEAGHLAQGSAGRNSGFMIDLPHELSSNDYAGKSAEADRLQISHNRQAIAFATVLAKRFGFGPEVFNPCGKINGAASERGHRQNLEYSRHLTSIDEPHELYGSARMKAITGCDYYRSGLFTPGTAILQPAAYIRALAGNLAKGARLFENSPVHGMERSGSGWKLKTPDGSLTATKIILAVNGHVESFGFFKRRLMHIFTYASLSAPMSANQRSRLGGAPRWNLTPADPMGVTVRKLNDNSGERLLIRSRFTYDPSMEIDKQRLDRVAIRHDRQFSARFPMLKDLPMQYRWGGQLCVSINSVPAFGEVDDGIIAACCHNGLGLTRGTLAGIAAAELACSTDSQLLQQMKQFSPPTRLVPEPMAWLGANAVLRFKEWRCGKE